MNAVVREKKIPENEPKITVTIEVDIKDNKPYWSVMIEGEQVYSSPEFSRADRYYRVAHKTVEKTLTTALDYKSCEYCAELSLNIKKTRIKYRKSDESTGGVYEDSICPSCIETVKNDEDLLKLEILK